MFNQLKYPFDINFILRKRKKLRSELLKTSKLKPIKIAILGGSTTSDISDMLEIFLLQAGFIPEFYISEYAKYFEDAVIDNTDLKLFAPDITYVFTTRKNIIFKPKIFDSPEEVAGCIEKELNRYKEIWQSLKNDLGCTIIQNNFDLPHVRTLGGLDTNELYGETNYIMHLNLEFAKEAREKNELIINDIFYLSSRLGLDYWHNPDYWFGYKMAITPQASIHLSHLVVNLIKGIYGLNSKCLVLDLDNTLWGGVIGDDGLAGISLGQESSKGEAFYDFQKYCSELNKRGIILSVCSKNDINNAKEGFSHSDSVLELSSFAAFCANWDMKSENIINIAKEINIGTDSLVFIDDNPVERSLVSSQLPEVKVPEVGANVSDYSKYIDREGFFETIKLSSDDSVRASAYAENKKRIKLQSKFENYGDFLESLEMVGEASVFEEQYLQRINQLTNKTNQFNLTTKRTTFSEIETIANSDIHIGIYGRLSDKFGDNGLVSVIAGEIKEAKFYIDIWLMSCRVLKREMEYFMLDGLVKECKKNKVEKLVGVYIPSPKNNMVRNHYKTLGFKLKNSNEEQEITEWILDISSYSNLNKHIKVDKK